MLSRQVNSLAQIEIDQIKKHEFRDIIIDLDNAVVSEDGLYLSPKAEEWVSKAKLAGLKFFILSNGK